jgi:IS1 family transposase
VLELDELWSFVRCKAQVRWLWVALCRRTRQVAAYVFGDRSEETCRRLWERIPEDYRLALCYSDFWRAYQSVIPEEQHAPVEKGSGQTNHVERWRTLAAPEAYVAFGCGSPDNVLLIPFAEFQQWLEGMGTTQQEDRFYWHVVIYREDGRFVLHRRKEERIDLSRFLLAGREVTAIRT